MTKGISVDRGSIWWASAVFDLRAIHLSVKSSFFDCSVVLLHMLLAQNSYVGIAINLSMRRSLVMTIPRRNRVSDRVWLEKCCIGKPQPLQSKPVVVETVDPN